jgi:N-acetyl-gamma-glutamylphosphate reductase
MDFLVLCGTPECASERIASANGDHKVIDVTGASVAHPGAVCGLHESSAAHRAVLSIAPIVSVPHPVVIALLMMLRPLENVLRRESTNLLAAHSVMGRSGAEPKYNGVHDDQSSQYVLDLAGERRRQTAELLRWGGPLGNIQLISAVGGFPRGLVLQLFLPDKVFGQAIPLGSIADLIQSQYAASSIVRVIAHRESVSVEGDNNTDCVSVFVREGAEGEGVLLVARLDNLGMGSTAAVISILQLALDPSVQLRNAQEVQR